MKCEFCEFALECKDPARYGGGCDIDGADDFGCGTCDDCGICDDDCEESEVQG